MKNKIINLFLMPVFLLTLGACGVKPSDVQSPEGAEQFPASYPATYPDERSDPPPPPVGVDHNMPPL